jgi:hypothetical protein
MAELPKEMFGKLGFLFASGTSVRDSGVRREKEDKDD